MHSQLMHGHVMHAYVMHAHIMHDHVMHAYACIVCFTSELTATCQLSLNGPNWFNSNMPTQMFQDQFYSESWHVANKLTASCPLPPKGNINHWHVAEQINSCMPTFHKKCQFFLLYIAEQFYVNYKMAPE
jgi:hypothetical protein